MQMEEKNEEAKAEKKFQFSRRLLCQIFKWLY